MRFSFPFSVEAVADTPITVAALIGTANKAPVLTEFSISLEAGDALVELCVLDDTAAGTSTDSAADVVQCGGQFGATSAMGARSDYSVEPTVLSVVKKWYGASVLKQSPRKREESVSRAIADTPQSIAVRVTVSENTTVHGYLEWEE